jgi:hypothetical protein
LKKGKYAFENTTVKREKSEIPTNKIIYLSGGINEGDLQRYLSRDNQIPLPFMIYLFIIPAALTPARRTQSHFPPSFIFVSSAFCLCGNIVLSLSSLKHTRCGVWDQAFTVCHGGV